MSGPLRPLGPLGTARARHWTLSWGPRMASTGSPPPLRTPVCTTPSLFNPLRQVRASAAAAGDMAFAATGQSSEVAHEQPVRHPPHSPPAHHSAPKLTRARALPVAGEVPSEGDQGYRGQRGDGWPLGGAGTTGQHAQPHPFGPAGHRQDHQRARARACLAGRCFQGLRLRRST